jgi:Mrp family chromosome partitioning ATPase
MSAPAGLQPPALRRTGPVIDGLRADRPGARWRRGAARLLVSKAERDEAELERRLGQQPADSRANVAAVASSRGGVGKSTCSFVIGNVMADRLRLRVVAVDANRDFGTLASLASPPMRCPRTPADLLADLDRIETATELRRYMAALPSGLHLLGAPDGAAVMAGLAPTPAASWWRC